MSESQKIQIEVECSECEGTGVYCGMAEPEGIGVVCIRCKGSCKETLSYTPFTGQKLRTGIHTVRLSAGMLLSSMGPTGGSVTYEQFLAGMRPERQAESQ